MPRTQQTITCTMYLYCTVGYITNACRRAKHPMTADEEKEATEDNHFVDWLNDRAASTVSQ